MKKIIWVVGFALAFAIPTLAQQIDEVIVLRLNNDEVNLIGKGLAELPFKDVVNLYSKIQKQISDQRPVNIPNQEKK
jgi:hypothetical protein